MGFCANSFPLICCKINIILSKNRLKLTTFAVGKLMFMINQKSPSVTVENIVNSNINNELRRELNKDNNFLSKNLL